MTEQNKRFEDYLIKDEDAVTTVALDMLDEILVVDNLAELLSDEQRQHIASSLIEQVDSDELSRKRWLDKSKDYIGLAMQLTKTKNFPFVNSANVRYPLLTQAALQFQARAYPLLFPTSKPLHVKSIGFNRDDKKPQRAGRVSAFMNWQLLEDIEDWDRNLDKMCLALAVVGCMFKKTYFDDTKEKVVSELLGPHEVIVNYKAKGIRDALRVTHVRYHSSNYVLQQIRAGNWVDFDPGAFPQNDARDESEDFDELNRIDQVEEELTPLHRFYEIHTVLDLDNDGYAEPYIATIHVDSNSLVGLQKRFEGATIAYNIDGKIINIQPDNYFTKIGFIANPWGFYDLGLGVLLGPLTATASSTINQMLDAGTLSTALGGLADKKLKIAKGAFKQRPFEFTDVSGNFDDLKKSVMFWPTKEPSPVLFNLLSLMINSGKEVANTMEAQVGENPGQNQPLGTTRLVMEQGMKVFSSIFRRIWRDMGDEYNIIYRLNRLYLNPIKYLHVLDLNEQDPSLPDLETIVVADFDDKQFDIVPSANPNADSQASQLLRATDLLTVAPNKALALRAYLQVSGAEEFHPNLDDWMQEPPPVVPPEIQYKMAELEHRKQIEWSQLEVDSFKAQYQAIGDQARALKAVAEASSIQDSAITTRVMSLLDALIKQNEVMQSQNQRAQEQAQSMTEGMPTDGTTQ